MAEVDPHEMRTRRVHLVSTILLACAAVATAWCSYQAARWTVEYREASGHTNSLRFSATRAQGLSEAQTEIDVATFIQWLDAHLLGRTELADFYFKRFRAEFRPAVVAWLATKPLTNPKAPLSPFAMPEYRLAADEEAKQLDAQAHASSGNGESANQHATNYVLAVVLFAVSLFFAGMSTKVGTLRQQEAMLVVGWALFLATAVWVGTSPVNVAI